mmetsp:Transcript_107612/g.334587  ORF Transcript_107612/g.334587 Transcript_107612/m.334587 type:complete len:121 (+) Transcript_107612:704-1066(+)
MSNKRLQAVWAKLATPVVGYPADRKKEFKIGFTSDISDDEDTSSPGAAGRSMGALAASAKTGSSPAPLAALAPGPVGHPVPLQDEAEEVQTPVKKPRFTACGVPPGPPAGAGSHRAQAPV